MLVMESKPGLSAATRRAAELRVERTDIVFCNPVADRVRIQVTVRNVGESPAAPTTMTIESAPFGAFVKWRPLRQLPVPSLKPGESLTLSLDAPRPRPAPLGNFNRIPPHRLLTALSAADLPPGPIGVQAFFQRWLKLQSAPSQRSPADIPLAPDIWDLVDRRQSHWVGNLNVFIGDQPVERHLAQALRVYAGYTNLAMFVVGNPGEREAFAFELSGLDPTWNAALYDATHGRSLEIGPSAAYIEESKWINSNGGLFVMLATQPPKDCQVGKLEVQVTRRSDQKTAIVEFDLNPAAAGPGCYSV